MDLSMSKDMRDWPRANLGVAANMLNCPILSSKRLFGYARIGPHRNFGLPQHPAMYPANQTGQEIAVAAVGEVEKGGSLYMLKLR